MDIAGGVLPLSSIYQIILCNELSVNVILATPNYLSLFYVGMENMNSSKQVLIDCLFMGRLSGYLVLFY